VGSGLDLDGPVAIDGVDIVKLSAATRITVTGP
jgi:hypothetical protein